MPKSVPSHFVWSRRNARTKVHVGLGGHFLYSTQIGLELTLAQIVEYTSVRLLQTAWYNNHLVFTTPPGAFPLKSWEGRKSTEDRKDCLWSFSSHPELALTLRVTSLHQSSTIPPAPHYVLIDISLSSRAPLLMEGVISRRPVFSLQSQESLCFSCIHQSTFFHCAALKKLS